MQRPRRETGGGFLRAWFKKAPPKAE